MRNKYAAQLCYVSVRLISAFVFVTLIVQSFFFLNLKFQATSHLLWLYSPVCVGPGQKPRRQVFSRSGSNMLHPVIYPTGFPEHIEYTPGSGRRQLAENAHLDICDESCKPDHISVKMSLATKHIGKGCDRDTYSITSQRKLCGQYPYFKLFLFGRLE